MQKLSIEELGEIAPIEIFASAIDKQDFYLAESILDPDASYHLENNITYGPHDIIDIFKRTAQWAEYNLDKVEYFHHLESCDCCHSVIKFVDILEFDRNKLYHQCLLHCTLSDDGYIIKLTLENLPGENDRLKNFLKVNKLDN